MDYDFDFEETEDDDEALAARRAGLRHFVKEVTAAVLVLPLPETYLEAEYAARAVTVADRVAEKLIPEADKLAPVYFRPRHVSPVDFPPIAPQKPKTPIDHVRKALRLYTDRLLKATPQIPLPNCFLEGTRALRFAQVCERLFTQLYAKPKGATDPEDDDYVPAEAAKPYLGTFRYRKGVDPSDCRAQWADWQFELEDKLIIKAQAKRERAEETGFWDNGKPYVPPLEFYGPVRYNPDGSVLCTQEELLHRMAVQEARQDAANKAAGWTPPDPP